MKNLVNFSRYQFLSFIMLFTLTLVVINGCKKTIHVDDKLPTKFTELKIDPAFEFENFKNVRTTITIPELKSSGINIVQIFNGNPAAGGRLIMTGSLDANNQYKTDVRLPASLKEIYIGKISSDGVNQYVAVPITGSDISYDFGNTTGSLKSTESISSNDCNTGCTSMVTGTINNLDINSGEMVCVDEGTSALFNNVRIYPGGILRICGTASVNSYYQGGSSGTIIISPTGTLTLPKYNTAFTIENYGTLNIAGSGANTLNGSLHNWGTVTISIKFQVSGTIINDGNFTITKDFTINPSGEFTNNCSLYLTNGGNNNLVQNGKLTNNGYISVEGSANLTGSGNTYTIFGLQSLLECAKFIVSGDLQGPVSQGSQIHAFESNSNQTKSSITGGANVTGYVDFWAGVIQNNGNTGPNVTFHNPGYIIPVPSCTLATPPAITSSLQAGGLVGEPITPYVITATGTEPITYDATNLPPGLTFNPATHTISGTPTAAGTTNVTITADNFMGIDTKILVFIITQPTAPPVITSPLTASTTVNQPYAYEITASGTGPITYDAVNLPDGLEYNPATNQITGIPTVAGTFNITLTATNEGGTDTETLVLTIGTPPVITSSLTIEGTEGMQIPTYTITATGSPDITYNAINLPEGLTFNPANATINGTPANAGVTEVTLTATNDYGSDIKILVITINAGLQPPVITSALSAGGVVNQAFNYDITATGSEPITYDATNLPAGLSLTGSTISGLPSTPGITEVTLTATNGAGSDTKILVITITSGGTTDTDGDGVPDSQDAYPLDPTRAFNSYYPNQVDFASLSFEDLWPAYGDYDCNDLVMNFNYKIVTNAQNKVVDVIGKFQIMAAGASLNNGFGISFNTSPQHVESVTGCIKLGNAINIDPKGYEIGHTTHTVIFPYDAINTLLGNGMVNTVPGGNTVQTTVDTVVMHFSTPQDDIGTPPYNPFIFIDQDRGKEVHLKDQPPTDLVDPAYFGTDNDASNPASGFYYRSSTGLPWGFEIPVSFNYPIESVDILQAYLHFAEWAESSGVSYPDWYTDQPGYRDASKIY